MDFLGWFCAIVVVCHRFRRLRVITMPMIEFAPTDEEPAADEHEGFPEDWVTLADLLYGGAERPVRNRKRIDDGEGGEWE